MHRHIAVLCLGALLVTAAACNEPVVFDPNQDQQQPPANNSPNNDDGDEDASDPTEDTDDPPPEDTGPPPGDAQTIIDPSVDTFRDVIMPILRNSCNGPICHESSNISARQYQVTLERDLTPEQLQENLDSTVAWVNFQAPTQSELLLQAIADDGCCAAHPPILTAEADQYRLMKEWIEDSTRVVEPDPGPDAGPEPDVPDEPDVPEEPELPVPCDSFPNPNDVTGPMRFGPYQQHVNDMLVERCTLVGGCHARPGNGGGLGILREEDDCSVQWNFLTARWFVSPERVNVLSSPLLTKPLGQQEPDQLHGGAVVFRGQDDCGFVTLKLWLEGDLTTPPTAPACDEF